MTLLRVYQEVEDVMPARHCTQTGRCCHFRTTGREPWVTHAEMLDILRALASQGRRVPAARADGACPLLAPDDMHCSVYDARPLGCRTYFCREAGGPIPARDLRDATNLLNTLDEQRGKKRGGRSLTAALESARRGKPTHG